MQLLMYDLVPGVNYEPLHDLLRSAGGAPVQFSTWVVPFNGPTLSTLNWLRHAGVVDDTDRVFVVELPSNHNFVWQNLMLDGCQAIEDEGIPLIPLYKMA